MGYGCKYFIGKKIIWKNIFFSVISTCEEFSVEHVDGLVVPGVLALQVHSVQDVLDEGRQHHGQQDGVLSTQAKTSVSKRWNRKAEHVRMQICCPSR